MPDFTNVDSILSMVLKLLTVPKPPDPPIPAPLILATKGRAGLSAHKIAAEIIKRRAEAGLPVGNLPDGSPNPDEMMEIIRMQCLIDALATDSRISVAIQPGVGIMASGADATGTPVTVGGVTTTIGIGNAVIQ